MEKKPSNFLDQIKGLFRKDKFENELKEALDQCAAHPDGVVAERDRALV